MLKYLYHKLVASATRELREQNANLSQRLSRIESMLTELLERVVHMEGRQIELIERTSHIEDKEDRLMSAAISLFGKDASLSMYLPKDFLAKHYDFGLFGMWFTQNYGASLTSYALGARIRELGYSVVQIDMPEIGGENCAWNMDNPGRVFIRQNFDTTFPMRIRNATMLNSICSAFVMGSDSLWGGNYRYQLDNLDGVLYGSFNTSKPILAFSTSWGGFEERKAFEHENRYMASLFARFTHISVRESASVGIMRQVFNTEASWTLDPVFLVKKSVWESLMTDSDKHGVSYIFAYILQPNEDKMRIVEEIRQKLNRVILNCCGRGSYTQLLWTG